MREHEPRCGSGLAAHGVGLTILATLLWLNPARAEPHSDKAAHGAMSMEQQLSQLDQLLPRRDVSQPPPDISPALWSTCVPTDNEMTDARVALGRKLYFDTRLSADGTVACATCHDTSRGFTDQRDVSEGIRNQRGRRNAPTTMNAFLMQSQFLDGRVPTLEAQAKLPIINPIEMGQPNGDAAVEAIAGDAEYTRLFQEAYGHTPSYENIGRALAAFERTLVFLDAPFDDFARNQPDALSPAAREGWRLFNEKGRCVTCHWINLSNPLGSDNRFHNIGVSARHQDFENLAGRALDELAKDGGIDNVDHLALTTEMSELGRFVVTKNRADIGGFKTSQLRNIALTAPYMHDGSMQTLWDVVDHYNNGGEANPYLDGDMEPLALSEDEIGALVEFMFALTDKRFAAQAQRELTRQRDIAASKRPFRNEALALRKQFRSETRSSAEPSGGPQ